MAVCFTNTDYSEERFKYGSLTLSKHRDAFVEYWINDNMITMDMASQIFEILSKPGYTHLTQVSYFLPNVLSANTGIDESRRDFSSFILCD